MHSDIERVNDLTRIRPTSANEVLFFALVCLLVRYFVCVSVSKTTRSISCGWLYEIRGIGRTKQSTSSLQLNTML